MAAATDAYRANQTEHRITLTQVLRYPQGGSYTKVKQIDVSLEGGTCRLVSHLDGIRDDKEEPGAPMQVRDQWGGKFRCVQLPLRMFEEDRSCHNSNR